LTCPSRLTRPEVVAHSGRKALWFCNLLDRILR
jgi:hypothetical protein